jgi:hypothetical protein
MLYRYISIVNYIEIHNSSDWWYIQNKKYCRRELKKNGNATNNDAIQKQYPRIVCPVARASQVLAPEEWICHLLLKEIQQIFVHNIAPNAIFFSWRANSFDLSSSSSSP